jgi:hypothetical protein
MCRDWSISAAAAVLQPWRKKYGIGREWKGICSGARRWSQDTAFVLAELVGIWLFDFQRDVESDPWKR